MNRLLPLALLLATLSIAARNTLEPASAWIRINQLGYTPDGIKVAIWASKSPAPITEFQLVNAKTKKIVFRGDAGKA